jgi:hypothetical protein
MMKRLLLCSLAASFLLVGMAVQSRRAPIRAYNGATVQQYDTMAVGNDERVELLSFQAYADDSAQTPTLTAWFVSANSKTVYMKLSTDPFTANQIKTFTWQGPWTFPKDSTILIYYNITGATPGTLDTLIVNGTYRLQKD